MKVISYLHKSEYRLICFCIKSQWNLSLYRKFHTTKKKQYKRQLELYVLNKKLKTKSQWCHIKLKLKKLTCISLEKICNGSIIRLANSRTKNNKSIKLKYLLSFFKTFGFNVMKTIRNQLKDITQVYGNRYFCRKTLRPVVI